MKPMSVAYCWKQRRQIMRSYLRSRPRRERQTRLREKQSSARCSTRTEGRTDSPLAGALAEVVRVRVVDLHRREGERCGRAGRQGEHVRLRVSWRKGRKERARGTVLARHWPDLLPCLSTSAPSRPPSPSAQPAPWSSASLGPPPPVCVACCRACSCVPIPCAVAEFEPKRKPQPLARPSAARTQSHRVPGSFEDVPGMARFSAVLGEGLSCGSGPQCARILVLARTARLMKRMRTARMARSSPYVDRVARTIYLSTCPLPRSPRPPQSLFRPLFRSRLLAHTLCCSRYAWQSTCECVKSAYHDFPVAACVWDHTAASSTSSSASEVRGRLGFRPRQVCLSQHICSQTLLQSFHHAECHVRKATCTTRTAAQSCSDGTASKTH